MTKVFVRCWKGNRVIGYQEKRIEYLSASNEAIAKMREDGWTIEWPPFLIEQDCCGGGDVDLTEVWSAISELKSNVTNIAEILVSHTDRITALEQGGGVNPGPSEFDFDVWCCPDGAPAVIAKSGAVKDKFGVVFGPTLSARFTIKEGTAVSAGLLYIVPSVQPTGYCHYFHGTARQECEKHGFTMMGEAEWHRRNEFGGGKWGIRLKFPNIDVVQAYYQNHEYIRPGGALYAEKGKPPLGAFGANSYHVTIPFT